MTTSSGGEATLVIGAGAQKAGTSSLHAWLGSLSEVATSHERKEIDFFSHHFERGLGWYEAQFDPRRPVWLDVSPNYFAVADLSERLEAVKKPVHVVLIARDPIARAVSQHLHNRIRYPGSTPRSFTQAWAQNPTYTSNSAYGQFLHRMETWWQEERLSVLFFEDLIDDPARQLDQLCARIGISARPTPEILATHANESRPVGSSIVATAYRSAGSGLRKLGGEHLVSKFRRSTLTQRVASLRHGSAADLDQDRVLTTEDLARLHGVFGPDLERAQSVTGLDFTGRYGR